MHRVVQAIATTLLSFACGPATTVPGEPAAAAPPSHESTSSPLLPSIDAAPILVGAWASDDGTTHERWVDTGAHLVGVGFVSRDDAKVTVFFDVMLIHRAAGHATFTAMPAGVSQVDFELSQEPDRLRFANPAHDDPSQIDYRRDGDRLAITVDGAAGPRRFDLQRREPASAPALEALDRAFAADSADRGGVAWAERFEAAGATWSWGSTRREGPAAIGASIDELRSSGRDLSWTPTASGLAPAGDMGFTSGRYRVSAREGGEVLGSGTYVTIWRRDADHWRIAFDTGVPDSAPAP